MNPKAVHELWNATNQARCDQENKINWKVEFDNSGKIT